MVLHRNEIVERSHGRSNRSAAVPADIPCQAGSWRKVVPMFVHTCSPRKTRVARIRQSRRRISVLARSHTLAQIVEIEVIRPSIRELRWEKGLPPDTVVKC